MCDCHFNKMHQPEIQREMSSKTRKMTGTCLLLAFIVVYSLLTLVLATVILPNASPGVELAFYALAGLVWTLPAGMIISWMAKP